MKLGSNRMHAPSMVQQRTGEDACLDSRNDLGRIPSIAHRDRSSCGTHLW